MIELATEPPIRLEILAKHCQTHFSTVYRWAVKGLPGPDGQRVRLEALRVGGRWVSSWPALQRFALAITPDLDEGPSKTPRSASKRQKASERAARDLARLHI